MGFLLHQPECFYGPMLVFCFWDFYWSPNDSSCAGESLFRINVFLMCLFYLFICSDLFIFYSLYLCNYF